jgi:acyl-coenzyme A synthetase/AMP-(fatty) acid ligase
MTVTDMPAPYASVTQRLVGLGPGRGERPALVGGSAAWPGRALSHAALAAVLQKAAAGLAWRGLRAQDVVGVHVPDAMSYVLAVHAIRAAGGVPFPVGPDSTVATMADQLSDCGARLLITAEPQAAAALRAADGSWVRQVISFDDVPGTISFCSLLSRGGQAPVFAGLTDLALVPYTSGPDGRPCPQPMTHGQLAGELGRVATAMPFTGTDVVLAVPPGGHSRDYTLLLDLALLHGATVVAAPAGRLAETAREHGGTAAIVHPGMSLPASWPLRAVTTAC